MVSDAVVFPVTRKDPMKKLENIKVIGVLHMDIYETILETINSNLYYIIIKTEFFNIVFIL